MLPSWFFGGQNADQAEQEDEGDVQEEPMQSTGSTGLIAADQPLSPCPMELLSQSMGISPNDWSTHTLSSLLASALPHAEMKPPQVIIMGAQSSGKTRVVLGMVFHHLLLDSGFSQPMGEALLNIFRTGPQTVTMRPIEVNLIRSAAPGINLKISLDGAEALFPSPQFDELICHFIGTTKLQWATLRLFISSPALPNISFTDLPGITTQDRRFADRPDATVRQLAYDLARSENNLIVVVETATNAMELDTSHIVPMIKDIEEKHRPDIFHHSVLVVTKCDTVVSDLYGSLRRVLCKADGRRGTYPFQHVVGVINKFPADPEPSTLAFPAFSKMFVATQRREQQRFEEMVGDQQAPLFATPALFKSIDLILHGYLGNHLPACFRMLQQSIARLMRDLYLTTAPPAHMYSLPRFTQEGTKGTAQGTGALFSVMVLLDEFTSHAKQYLKRQLMDAYTSQLGLYLAIVGSLPFRPTVYGDIDTFEAQRAVVGRVRSLVVDFLDGLPLTARLPLELKGPRAADAKTADVEAMDADPMGLGDEAVLGFCEEPLFAYASMHNILRFPRLCLALQRQVCELHREDLAPVYACVDRLCAQLQDVEMANAAFTSAHLADNLRRLLHVAVCQVFEVLSAKVDGVYAMLAGLSAQEVRGLLREEPRLADYRAKLYSQLLMRINQLYCLEQCNVSTTLEGIREVLTDSLQRLPQCAMVGDAAGGGNPITTLLYDARAEEYVEVPLAEWEHHVWALRQTAGPEAAAALYGGEAEPHLQSVPAPQPQPQPEVAPATPVRTTTTSEAADRHDLPSPVFRSEIEAQAHAYSHIQVQEHEVEDEDTRDAEEFFGTCRQDLAMESESEGSGSAFNATVVKDEGANKRRRAHEEDEEVAAGSPPAPPPKRAMIADVGGDTFVQDRAGVPVASPLAAGAAGASPKPPTLIFNLLSRILNGQPAASTPGVHPALATPSSSVRTPPPPYRSQPSTPARGSALHAVPVIKTSRSPVLGPPQVVDLSVEE